MTSIWVSSAKFYINLSFCLRELHFFSKWFHRFAFPARLLTTVARSAMSIIWKNDWMKSGVTLFRTLLTEQWISGVIDCVNVSSYVNKELCLKAKAKDWKMEVCRGVWDHSFLLLISSADGHNTLWWHQSSDGAIYQTFKAFMVAGSRVWNTAGGDNDVADALYLPSTT